MDPNLVFHGHWTIEVTRLDLNFDPPDFRLVVTKAGAAAETIPNPPVGTRIDVDGPEWALNVEISFDQHPYRNLDLARDFAFDPKTGLVATVKGGWFGYQTTLALRLTAHDSELRARPVDPYDFTLPEGARPPGG